MKKSWSPLNVFNLYNKVSKNTPKCLFTMLLVLQLYKKNPASGEYYPLTALYGLSHFVLRI